MKNMWFVLSTKNNRTLWQPCWVLLGTADRLYSLVGLGLQILQNNLNTFLIPTQTWTWWFSKCCCLGNLPDPFWAFKTLLKLAKARFSVLPGLWDAAPNCTSAFFPTLGGFDCLCSYFWQQWQRCGASLFPSCLKESSISAQHLNQGHQNIFVLWLFTTENCQQWGQRCFMGSPETWVSTFNFLSDTDLRGHETGLLL